MDASPQFRRGIRWKLLVTMLGLIVGLLAAISWLEIDASQQIIKREMERRVQLMRDVLVARGEGAATQLAKEIGNHIAGFAFSAVSEIVTNATRLNPQLSYALVLNTKAQALAHAGGHGALIHFDGELKQYTGADDRMAAGQTGILATNVVVDRTEVLEIIAPIVVGNERWGVLRLGYSLADLRREILSTRREMQAQVGAVITRSVTTAGLAVFLSMGVVAWLSALITQPLQRVTESARQLATGDFSAAATLDVRSQDEVGVLAEAFTKMADNLQRTYAQLEESNRTLELKVSERTRELAHMTELAEEARQQAEGANRTKSSFLASMSHELRTPLAAIIGFSEMLLADAQAEGRAEAADDLQRIMDSAKHLLGLINEILDLSKIEAQKMELHLERFEVANVLREVGNTLTPLVKKRGNQLVVSAAPDLGSIQADLTKLRQCLLNLLSNASKFTEKGTVRLHVERFTREGVAFIRFAVSDTGIGMTPEQLGRLFQAFQQADSATSRKYGGTGLGLVITKKFCELMGGNVSVSSEPGKGSTFTLELPAEVRKPEPKPALPAGKALPAGGAAARTVLVLSADKNVQQLVGDALVGSGCQLRVASNDAAGLTLARETRPVLITLDAAAPGADGWSAMGQLKSDPELAAIPVILLTLKDGQADAGFTLGAAEFLAKPVNSALLGRALHRHLHYPPDGYVLLVEDDPVLREMMSRMIENEKFPVTAAENGRRALELVKQSIPKLILLDIMMPVMDGFQFLGELRQRKEWAHIPVVVLTAKTLSPAERDFLAAHTNSVLQKGASVRDDVMANIRHHISKEPEPVRPGT